MSIIRIASPKDLEVVSQIARAAFYDTYPSILSTEQIEYMLAKRYSLESLTHEMNDLKHIFILVEEAEKIIGFVSFSCSTGRMRLHKIYLLPESKGKGYGKELINCVCKEALNHGFEEIELNVNRYNQPAIDFYKKNGFVIDKEEDLEIGPYLMNDYVMIKKM